MHITQAVITGLIQGLSEFLPVSSSAHIVFSNELYNLITGVELTQDLHQEELFFDIIVHLGTLIAVIVYFYRDLEKIFKNFVISIKNKNYENKETKLLFYIALSTIITGAIGLIIKKPVEFLTTKPEFICIFLMITGILLLLCEKMYKGNKDITLKNSIFIALAQGLAVFPGFSRSGLTMSSAIFQGIDRERAARFSFLMSIPVIILASMVYPLLELDFETFSKFNWQAIITGFFVSGISGYFCIKYFMELLKKTTLRFFGYYCLFSSLLMFLLFQVFHRV